MDCMKSSNLDQMIDSVSIVRVQFFSFNKFGPMRRDGSECATIFKLYPTFFRHGDRYCDVLMI